MDDDLHRYAQPLDIALADIGYGDDLHLLLTGRRHRAEQVASALESSIAEVRAMTAARSSGDVSIGALLPPPSGLVARNLGGDSATLLWGSVEHASSYAVTRDGELLGESMVRRGFYIDDTVRHGRVYVYAVAARSWTGRVGSPTNGVTFSLDDPRYDRPPIPSAPTNPTPQPVEFDPNWIPDIPHGQMIMRLGAKQPLTLGALLEQRNPITAEVTRYALGNARRPAGGHGYVSVPIYGAASLSAFATAPAARELGEFVCDLRSLGTELVLRIES